MSKKKVGGKTTQHERPTGKRLGLKVSHGQKVNIGEIILRQRGTVFHAGGGTLVGRDHTIYAHLSGLVKFGQKFGKKFVSVISN